SAHDLQDSDSLLVTAAAELRAMPPSIARSQNEKGLGAESGQSVGFVRVWIDGFSDFSEQELDLLLALARHCVEITVTFCLDPAQRHKGSWLSHWSNVNRSYQECQKRFALVPGAEVLTEQLSVDCVERRFSSSPVLQHLASNWAEPLPFGHGAKDD